MKIDRYDETLFQEMIRFRPDIVFLNLSGNDKHSKSEPKQIAENMLAFVCTLKTNKMTSEHSEDSDQPGRLPSLIRGFTVRGSLAPHKAPSEYSDQTGRMPWWI